MKCIEEDADTADVTDGGNTGIFTGEINEQKSDKTYCAVSGIYRCIIYIQFNHE